MRKADIARCIQEQAGMSEAEAADLLEVVLELLTSTLCKGEPIIITGFGTFRVRDKQPRRGRNPSTGEAMIIRGRRVITFRPSALWKAQANADGETMQH